jgi:hypothetical protein
MTWVYGEDGDEWDAYFITGEGYSYQASRSTGGYDPEPFGITYAGVWRLLLDTEHLRVSEYRLPMSAGWNRYQILVKREQDPSS